LLRASGVSPHESAGLIDAARAAAEPAGTAVLEVALAPGRPQVTIRRERVARPPVAPAGAPMAVGGAP
jgi:hypothetical protein